MELQEDVKKEVNSLILEAGADGLRPLIILGDAGRVEIWLGSLATGQETVHVGTVHSQEMLTILIKVLMDYIKSQSGT